MGVLGAMPRDDDWGELCRCSAVALEEARSKLTFLKEDMHHRRGMYPAFAVGLSHGGGQTVCFLRPCNG
jgi:hypothetical protein